MYDIDKNEAFLLIESRSQRAEDAFSLQENKGILIQSKQPPQPTNVAPAATASESALLLTLDKLPINPQAGYLFGSSKDSCDVLLDTKSNRGVGSKSFSISHHHETHDIVLQCLAHKGIFYREATENELKKLSQGSSLRLSPAKTWIVVVGSVQIALKAIVRDRSEQQTFDRNLRDFITRLGNEDPNVGGLAVDASGTSTLETPDTRVLKGIWGSYTAAGRVGGGSYAWITGCVSDTGITCCIKEIKADLSERAKVAFKQEIKLLRRLVHPCIVQYIDRDPNGAWLAMDYLNLGDLWKQQEARTFAPWETRAVTYQVLHALDHIHSNDIIHHDLKPGNILVKARNEDRIWVKVADFGLSTWIPITEATKRGTPKYLAPECFERPADLWKPKIDIWALAVVALILLGHCPDTPEDTTTESDHYTFRSPYAEGWHGALEDNFKRFRQESGVGSDPFFTTLSRMFDPHPEFRISASKACEDLHEEYRQGKFLLSGDRTPAFHNPVPVANTRSDDASIFRFRELKAQGSSLTMLEGCYLVSLTSIMEAKCEESGMDQEVATYGVMEKYFGQPHCTFWQFMRTDAEWPETYIRIELAMKICHGDSNLQRFVAILRQQQAQAQRDDTDNERPGKLQLSLLESSFTSSHVITITEEGRMLLVRHTDGFIYGPSVQAVVNKCLLPMDALSNKPTYQPVDGAMLIPGVMSHVDFWWLSAAAYTSF